MRLKALTLSYVLNTHIMGVECLENFLRALKGRGVTFFRLGRVSRSKSSEKLNFGSQNDSKKIFLNVSKVFGT